MLGFEYIFHHPVEIIKKIHYISNFSLWEYFILLSIICIYFILIYYIIPYFKYVWEQIFENKKRGERKNIINKMVFQKDIEAEIEKELNI